MPERRREDLEERRNFVRQLLFPGMSFGWNTARKDGERS